MNMNDINIVFKKVFNKFAYYINKKYSTYRYVLDV